MGGKVAQQLASSHPEKCMKVISADIGTKKYPRDHDEIFEAMKNLDTENITSRKQADELLSSSIPEFGVRQFILKGLQRTELGYHWKFNVDALYNNYDHIINKIESDPPSSVEILFMKGSNSNYVSLDDEENILLVFQNAQFKIIPNAGHWLHADNPIHFFQESLAFLQS